MSTEKTHILIVEDEEDILALLHYNLMKAGYRVECATDGEEALRILENSTPDLLLLDLLLPGIGGLEICRKIRAAKKTAQLPIIMLSALGEEGDVVKGLDLGADDYVVKPFSMKILLARILSVLRRRDEQPADDDEILRGQLWIHPGRNLVKVAGEVVELTHTEFRVLLVLASRPGWVFTRYQIVNAVRGEAYAVTDRAVDVQIVGLRKRLGICGAYIETVRGIGYRFCDSFE